MENSSSKFWTEVSPNIAVVYMEHLWCSAPEVPPISGAVHQKCEHVQSCFLNLYYEGNIVCDPNSLLCRLIMLNFLTFCDLSANFFLLDLFWCYFLPPSPWVNFTFWDLSANFLDIYLANFLYIFLHFRTYRPPHPRLIFWIYFAGLIG